MGWDWDGSPGGRGYRAPYGANNLWYKFEFEFLTMLNPRQEPQKMRKVPARSCIHQTLSSLLSHQWISCHTGGSLSVSVRRSIGPSLSVGCLSVFPFVICRSVRLSVSFDPSARRHSLHCTSVCPWSLSDLWPDSCLALRHHHHASSWWWSSWSWSWSSWRSGW